MKRHFAVKLAMLFTLGLYGSVFMFEAAQPGLLRDTIDAGWSDPDKSQASDRAISAIPDSWVDSGKGQTRLLYQDYAAVYGSTYEPRNQGNAPSCVGQATAAAVDFLAAVQIAKGYDERPPYAGASAAIIYGLSRHQIGHIPPEFGGGSHCVWACQAIQQYGVVPMVDYPLIGVYLAEPSAKLCVEYGRTGVSTALQDIAKLHPVIEFIKIQSFNELRDAMQNGCPVVVGSRQGFGDTGLLTRDEDGFLVPPRGLFRKSQWAHAMVFIGVRDSGRKGALILNSWGPDWVQGPKAFGDEPEGSFWADDEVVNKMLSYGDSYAIYCFIGYPKYHIWR